jgi:hypothetical protein
VGFSSLNHGRHLRTAQFAHSLYTLPGKNCGILTCDPACFLQAAATAVSRAVSSGGGSATASSRAVAISDAVSNTFAAGGSVAGECSSSCTSSCRLAFHLVHGALCIELLLPCALATYRFTYHNGQVKHMLASTAYRDQAAIGWQLLDHKCFAESRLLCDANHLFVMVA